jgi:hypothetical protein
MSPDAERIDARPLFSSRTCATASTRKRRRGSPESAQGLGRADLSRIGAKMLELKKQAPRSPGDPASALKTAVDAVIA